MPGEWRLPWASRRAGGGADGKAPNKRSEVVSGNRPGVRSEEGPDQPCREHGVVLRLLSQVDTLPRVFLCHRQL